MKFWWYLIPHREWLESRKSEPDYSSALLFYRIFWGSAFLLYPAFICFCVLVCYSCISAGLKKGDVSGVVWLTAGILGFITCCIMDKFRKPAKPNG